MWGVLNDKFKGNNKIMEEVKKERMHIMFSEIDSITIEDDFFENSSDKQTLKSTIPIKKKPVRQIEKP